MKKHRARRPAHIARPQLSSKPPERPVGLPQDSVLRAHLRRQADWAEDGPRLCRRPDGNTARKRLLAEIDRIGGRSRTTGEPS